MDKTFFGLQDGSGKAWENGLYYGSLRLWDSGTQWAQIEHSLGVYDWTRLDAYVDQAKAHGAEVTWTMAMTPAFYGTSTRAPGDLDTYRRFVTEAMMRYGTRISTYQVWNEANVKWFWTGPMTEMASLSQIVTEVRDKILPGTRVLSPSFGVRMRYQRKMLTDYLACWGRDDAIALSLYPDADGGTPEDAYALLRQVRQENPDLHIKPIWVAEVNYGVGAPLESLAEPGDQVANVLRTYLLGLAHHVDRVHWYRYDWNHTPAGWLGNTMLSDPAQDYAITRPGNALRRLMRWVGDGEFGSYHADDQGVHCLNIDMPHQQRSILWAPQVSRTQVGVKEFQDYRGKKFPVQDGSMLVGPTPRMIIY